MSHWNTPLGDVSHQDLIDGFVDLILKVHPQKNPDTVRENVQKKIAGITAQEPFFLRAVLANSELSDGDKVGMFVGVHDERDSHHLENRYPTDYHTELRQATQSLSA